ncbi:MAG: hexosaminidase [Verrucomicrobiales bacterium]|jgi:hexosaminidase
MMTMSEISIIPLPAKIEQREGSFVLPDAPSVGGKSGVIALACEQLTSDSELSWQPSEEPETVIFQLDQDLAAEAYRLKVTINGVSITASGDAGHFYGIQSLRQLCSPERRSLPCLHIEDAPRFPWRGMHLDVSRHFFDGNFVRRYIDLLAQHKLNVFHWHLTDDDGWRIELDSYPELTERTAWRGKNEALPPSYDSGDARYGGFYSKKEIREIITYAAERQVIIVPEIDVPGHCKPVTICHPELLCEGDIAKFKSIQEVPENLLCAGREETFKFLSDVIKEVAELFPSPYLHMGGDERPEGPWEQCPLCARRIADEKLENVDALQGYFMERVRQMVTAEGKTMVGWNEITHGNKVDRSAVVTAWQDPEKGILAAKAGYPVVMAPAQHTYFDLAQGEDSAEPGLRWAGVVTLEKAYQWEPVADPDFAHQVMGIEGCLWSETLMDEARVDYMGFPRICALAEVAWTPSNRRDWLDFKDRLVPSHIERLRCAGVDPIGKI